MPITLITGEELYPWRPPAFHDFPAGRCAASYNPFHQLFYQDAAGSRLIVPDVAFADCFEPFAVYGKLKLGTDGMGDNMIDLQDYRYLISPPAKKDASQSTGN
jgi:hypothetical protein